MFPNKFTPTKSSTKPFLSPPAMKETANRLNQRFQSPPTTNLTNYEHKQQTEYSMLTKISKTVVDAIEIEAEELAYPMTLYTLTDHLMGSDTVMDMHANPSQEEHEEELGPTGIFHAFSRLSIDPEQRQKELKRALNELQSSVGSITSKISSWQEAKAKLSSVLVLPNDADVPRLVLQQDTNKINSFKRMTLGRAREKKCKKKGKWNTLGDLGKYLALIKRKDKHNRSFASENKWKELSQMTVPDPIDSISKDNDNINAADVPFEKEKAVESVTAKMDKLLRSRTEEAEREARAREIKEQERIETEIKEKEEEENLKAEALKAASKLLRTLTEEEHALVREALYGPGPESEKLASTASDSVQRKSMRTLRLGQWLNDEVISYFYKMLANRDEALTEANPGRKRSHYFSSFFFTKLFDEGCTDEYSYKNVKRWSKKVPGKDIFALDKVFFTCNVSKSHWTCAVIFMEEKRIQFYDSMSGDGYGYTTGLMRYLKDEWAAKKGGELPDADEWKIVGAVDGVPQQENGYDCGVFTCMFGDFLSLDRPLSFNQNHVNQCRERIALSILKGVAIE